MVPRNTFLAARLDKIYKIVEISKVGETKTCIKMK